MKKSKVIVILIGGFLLVGMVLNVMIGFEDLIMGTKYHVGDWFNTNGFYGWCEPFQLIDGTWIDDGVATVEDAGLAGGTGNEMNLVNITMGIELTAGDVIPIGLTLLYGDNGGNLNLLVNGEFRNVEDFIELDGETIGGLTVEVDDDGTQGTLTLKGGIGKSIYDFRIGGQDLSIDDMDIDPCFIGAVL